MASRRNGRARREWTNGPAKLAEALAIDRALNGFALFGQDSGIWLESAEEIDDHIVERGPRIGLGKTPEPWLSIPWRYWIRNNPFVSR